MRFMINGFCFYTFEQEVMKRKFIFIRKNLENVSRNRKKQEMEMMMMKKWIYV